MSLLSFFLEVAKPALNVGWRTQLSYQFYISMEYFTMSTPISQDAYKTNAEETEVLESYLPGHLGHPAG